MGQKSKNREKKQITEGQGPEIQAENVMDCGCKGHSIKVTEDYLKGLETQGHGRKGHKASMVRGQKANKTMRK